MPQVRRKLSDLWSVARKPSLERSSSVSEDMDCEYVSSDESEEAEQFSEVKCTFESTGNTLQLGSICFYDQRLRRIQPQSVANIKGSSSWDTSPTNLMDSTPDLFWRDDTYCSRGKSELIVKFAESVTIRCYELITSPEDPSADPHVWKIHGRRKHSEWILLDKRLHVSPPPERKASYGMLELNYGREAAPTDILASVDEIGHLDPQKIRLFSSCEVSLLWTADRELLCPEYTEAQEQIAIHHNYMSRTKMQRCIDFLDEIVSKEKSTKTFPCILKSAIGIAFQIPENTAKFYCSGEGEDKLNYFNSIMKLYDSFTWRKEYLLRSLHKIKEQNPDLLADTLFQLAQVGSKHKSIQIELFHYVIQLVYDMNHKQDQKREPRDVLEEAFLRFLDDFKVKAFRSAFVEPSKFYFHLLREVEKQNSAEIHCSSLYAGLLLSTLGIQIPVMPYFLDDAKDCPPFLRIKNRHVKEAFKRISKRFGSPWEKVDFCRTLIVPQVEQLPVNIYSNEVTTAIEISNKAIDLSPELHEFREEVAKYLLRFARYFTKRFIYEKMYLVLSSEHESELDCIFQELKQSRNIREDTLREYLYQKKFNRNRAHILFKKLGFVC